MENIDEEVEGERLRHVRALIEDLLREADVCAFVVLAGKAGRIEHFAHLSASWSNLRLEALPDGGEYLGLRSKAADYGGDVEAQRQHQAWSVGVVSSLGLILGESAMAYLMAAKQFDKMTGATHTPFKRVDPRDKR